MACLPSRRKGKSALCLSWDVDLLRMDFGPPGSQAFGLGLNYISGFPGQQRTDRTTADRQDIVGPLASIARASSSHSIYHLSLSI